MIDHVLIDQTTFYDVQNFTIKDDAPLNVSRHLPLLLTLRVNTNQSADNATSHTRAFTRINYRWNTPLELRIYERALYASISHVKHRDTQDINARYNHIVKCLSSAAETTLPKRQYNKLLKPYWNTPLKDLHENMRTLRHYWVADGKVTVSRRTIHHFGVTKTANVSSANVYARPPGYTSKGSSAVLNNYLSWSRRGFGKVLVQENPRSVVQVVNLYLEIAERKQ